MKLRRLSVFLVLCLLLALVSSAAADAPRTQNGISYLVSGGEATVVGLPDTERVTIPASLGGYPVVTLRGNLLAGHKTKTLTLPNTLRVLGVDAFRGSALTSVDIPDGVELCWGSLGSLKEVVGDPNSEAAAICRLSGIPFRDRNTGELLEEPQRVTLEGVEYAILTDRVLVTGYDRRWLPTNVKLAEVVERKPVTGIWTEAFSGCTRLEALTIPDMVSVIYPGAFRDCTMLTTAVLPEGLEYLYADALQGSALSVLRLGQRFRGMVDSKGTFDRTTCGKELTAGALGTTIVLYAPTVGNGKLFRDNPYAVAAESRVYRTGPHLLVSEEKGGLRLEKAVVFPDKSGEGVLPMELDGEPIVTYAPNSVVGHSSGLTFLGTRVKTVESGAFALYDGTDFYIPDLVTAIAKDAFPAKTPISIVGYPGTEAQTFAKRQDYEFDSPGGMGFEDVPAGAWYADYVGTAFRRGLVSGTSETTFNPSGITTRAMVVRILFNLAGEPGFPETFSFADVPEGRWYSQAISWAAAKGYVNGVGNNRFDPNAPMTREQVATILYRFAEQQGLDVSRRADLSGYRDQGQISKFAKDAVSWAVANGLMNGTSPTTLAPKGQSTRAQIATIMVRFVDWMNR